MDESTQPAPQDAANEQRIADAPLVVPTPESFLRPPPDIPKNRARPDPWAHRRAEPRPFALMWTGYLLLATVACLGPITAAMFLTPEVYRPAATMLLATTALGISVFWPMVRLSQELPLGRISSAVGLDMVALFFPLQATIWPQIIPALSDWDAPIALAVSLHCTSWLLITGVALTTAMGHLRRREARGRPTSLARTLWTVLFLALSVAAALVNLVLARPTVYGSVPTGATLWAAAPGIFEITKDRSWSGRAAAVPADHWRWILFLLGSSIVLWMLMLFIDRPAQPRPAPLRPQEDS